RREPAICRKAGSGDARAYGQPTHNSGTGHWVLPLPYISVQLHIMEGDKPPSPFAARPPAEVGAPPFVPPNQRARWFLFKRRWARAWWRLGITQFGFPNGHRSAALPTQDSFGYLFRLPNAKAS